MGGPQWRKILTAEHCDCHFTKQNALINNLSKLSVPCEMAPSTTYRIGLRVCYKYALPKSKNSHPNMIKGYV